MGVVEDLADALARDVLESAPHLGDEHDLIREIAKALSASSTTTEEAFMTAIRVRIAERRARALLNEMRAAKGLPPAGARPASAQAGPGQRPGQAGPGAARTTKPAG